MDSPYFDNQCYRVGGTWASVSGYPALERGAESVSAAARRCVRSERLTGSFRGVKVGRLEIHTPPLPDKKYSIIYADPPWWYSNVIRNRKGVHSGAYQHYPVMKTPEICALPIAEIAEENSLLFLWTTGALLEDGIQVGTAWGFKYTTVAFVWNKPNKPICGYYTMSQCEFCLVFKKGKIPKPRGKRNIRQLLTCKAVRHAEKPHQIRDRIVEMFPTQRKIELFARQRFRGWDAWGNEVETDD